MPLIYNSANAVIIPSKESKGVIEGSSYTVLEAMACAKPVLLSNIGPFKSIIEHEKTGILFDLDHPEELMNWIIKLKEDPDLSDQIGKKARLLIEKKYSLDSKINDLLSIYGIIS